MADATRAEEVEALREAIEVLDAVWDFDAERGNSDARGGAEYERLSPVPRLRDLLARLEEED